MRHEDRIGQSAWDYGTVVIIMIATFAVSPGNARVYGEELLSAPVAGTILDRATPRAPRRGFWSWLLFG
jgi:hypothetical protein